MKKLSIIAIFLYILMSFVTVEAQTSDELALDIMDEQEYFEEEGQLRLWRVDEESTNPLGDFYVDDDGNEYFFAPNEVILDEDGSFHTIFTFRGGRKRNCNAVSGVASWYGPGFHGKKTANGEIFNQNALTAAHKTIKFGSIVKVTFNGKSVNVRINDAGPYVGKRVIDLSKAAAQAIGLIGPGTGRVQLTMVKCGR